MKKKLLMVMTILLVLAVAIAALMTLGERGFEKGEEMTVDAEFVGTENATDAADVAEAKENKSAPENETEETIVDESEEIKATAPVVVEVIQDDPNTNKIILENQDGEKTEVQMGVVDLEEDIQMTDKDDPVPEKEDESQAETKPAIETEPEETEITSTILQTGQIGPDESTTYLEYEAMSAQEQALFYYSFANAEAFNEWYNSAKEEYEANIDKVYINADGSVDMG